MMGIGHFQSTATRHSVGDVVVKILKGRAGVSLLKDVLVNEVYPALGCTEPISCAFAVRSTCRSISLARPRARYEGRTV